MLSPFSETVRKRGVEKERPDPLRKPCSPCSLLLPALSASPLPTPPSVRPADMVRKVATVDALTDELVEPGRRLRRRRPSVLTVEGATMGEVHRESSRLSEAIASRLSPGGPATLKLSGVGSVPSCRPGTWNEWA